MQGQLKLQRLCVNRVVLASTLALVRRVKLLNRIASNAGRVSIQESLVLDRRTRVKNAEKYLDELGKTSESSCKVCSVGRKGELEGLKAAYDDSNNAVGCVNCSTGKHQDITGSSACKDVGRG